MNYGSTWVEIFFEVGQRNIVQIKQKVVITLKIFFNLVKLLLLCIKFYAIWDCHMIYHQKWFYIVVIFELFNKTLNLPSNFIIFDIPDDIHTVYIAF